jgi:hypothetical protein
VHILCFLLHFIDTIKDWDPNLGLYPVGMCIVPDLCLTRTLKTSKASSDPEWQSLSSVFISPWRKKYLILLPSCCASTNVCILCNVLRKFSE